MDIAEPTNLSLTEENHHLLKELANERYFNTMVDGYRFAIGLALAHRITPQEKTGNRQTIFGVASVDPEKELYNTVKVLCPLIEGSIYKEIERLADWGVSELFRLHQTGKLDILNLLKQHAES